MATQNRRIPAQRTQKQRKNQIVNFGVPVGGLNARDALDSMAPQDAVSIVNFYPAEGYISSRGGFTLSDSSGITSGSTIQTIFEFANATVQHQIIANDATIYRADVATVNVLNSGFTEGRWDWVNFNGYAIMANGADAMQYYNASTAATLPLIVGTSGNTIKKGSTASAFTTSSTVIGVHVHRSHMYLWEDDSQTVYYGGLNEVFPEIEAFNLGFAVPLGGKLVAVGSWAVGGAANAAFGGQFQDVICFLTDQGELLVYEGDDPGSNFALIGVYRIGRPLGRDCMERVADDLLIATEFGLIPVSQVIKKERADPNAFITDKIRGKWLDVAGQYFDNVGWQVQYFPKLNYVLVNVPVRPIETAATGNSRYDQLVFNLNTGAWTTYTGQPAACFGLYAGALYFGGADLGAVYQAENGLTDNGADIYVAFDQAFQALGTRVHCNAIQPAVWTDGAPTIYVGANVGYVQSTALLVKYTPTPPGATWDEIGTDWDLWDVPWGSDTAGIVQNWKSIAGKGDSVGVSMYSYVDEELRIYNTDIELEGAAGF